MLARSTLRAASRAPALVQAAPNARGMATLRELELRLKSVRNIEKITKARWPCKLVFKYSGAYSLCSR
jgi:F-type H+-transporting ATPase subunit gamma